MPLEQVLRLPADARKLLVERELDQAQHVLSDNPCGAWTCLYRAKDYCGTDMALPPEFAKLEKPVNAAMAPMFLRAARNALKGKNYDMVTCLMAQADQAAQLGGFFDPSASAADKQTAPETPEDTFSDVYRVYF